MDTFSESGIHDEWELSKENVQPLKVGRKVSNLTAALQPLGDQQAKIKEQKQSFETELRTYGGDDPFDVWDRYIKWTEQCFPKGGREGSLHCLLERCVSVFKDDERYKNDIRYIHTWVKFANCCSEPLEIYNFLHSQGIGSCVSLFYESWAWLLEEAGNPKKADSVYNEGMQRNAQPQDSLRTHHAEFQARISRRVMADGTSDPMEYNATSEQRTVLGSLKCSKKGAAPNVRTAVKRGAHGLGVSSKPVAQIPNQKFKIFSEENMAPTSLPPQTGEYSSVPTRETLRKENEQKPGIWTSAKLPQKSGGGSICRYTKPDFSVHEDDVNDDVFSHSVHRDKSEIAPQVLSAHKPQKPANPLACIQNTYQDPGFRPMYCKHKIYTGTSEFSFEELRAARWKAMKQQRDMENRIDEQQSLLQQQQLEIERLKRLPEDIARQQEEFENALRRHQEAALQQQEAALQQQQQQFQMHLETERKKQENNFAMRIQQPNLQDRDSKLDINKQQERSQQAQEQPFYENPQMLGTNQQSQNGAQGSENQFFQKSQQGSGNLFPGSNQLQEQERPQFPDESQQHSHDRSQFQERSHLQERSLGSDSKYGRRALTAPSPTVHTREAIQLVMGMFNNTLEVEPAHGDKTNFDASFEAQFLATSTAKIDMPGSQLKTAGGIPFTIFDESDNKPKPMPIQIYEDKENFTSRPKNSLSTGAKPKTFGVLQQIKDEPLCPMEDEQCPNQSVFGQTEVIKDSDATFAPSGSNMDFAAASRLASTPFNPLTMNAPLPEPPLSTIKADMGQNTNQRLCDTGLKQGLSDSNRMHDVDKENSNASIGAAARTTRLVESFDVTHQQQKLDLSPITEEEENHGSSGASSTHSSNGTNHMTHNTIDGSHHIQQCIAPNQMNHNTIHRSHHIPQFIAPSNASKSRPESPMDVGAESKSTIPTSTSEQEPFQLDQTMQHFIDTTMFVFPETDEKTACLLNMSIALDPFDPFNDALVSKFLSRLPQPIASHAHYTGIMEDMPDLIPNTMVTLGDEYYNIKKLFGEGSYAKVYRASPVDMSNILSEDVDDVVIKVQKPACPWEFYIANELHKRLADRPGIKVKPCIMSIERGIFFNDGSCLMTSLHQKGTLLDVVNMYKRQGMQLPESIIMYLTIEMLAILEQVHACKMIHGDIKPDNFLIQEFPIYDEDSSTNEIFGASCQTLMLIDFGRSIDMTMFPTGTTFTTKVNTSGFQCIEMKTDQPWTYQTDLFGLVGSVHVMIFGDYMKVYQSNGRWKTNSTVKRWWRQNLWRLLFDELLNINSCEDLPDIAGIRKQFQDCFLKDMINTYNGDAKRLSILLFEK